MTRRIDAVAARGPGRSAIQRRVLAAVAVLGLLSVSGCAQDAGGPGGSAAAGFPMTFENCGRQVTIARPPERVLLLQDGAVSLLAELGALDKVIAIAGKRAVDTYPEEIRAQVEPIPGLGTPSDGQEVSLEALIAQTPDLMIGSVTGLGLTGDAVSRVGAPVIELPTFCEDKTRSLRDPTFDDIYPQLEFYGRLFGTEDRAAAAVTDLRERVAAVQRSVQGSPGDTGVALFVSGGIIAGGYGAGSMQDAQLRAIGLTNALGEVPGRYIDEPNHEALIARNPELIIAITDFDGIGRAASVVRSAPAYGSVTAVRTDAILELPFQFTDPPTPLSVTGLERIAEFVKARNVSGAPR